MDYALKTIAMDTSTKSTGWAIFDNDNLSRSGLIDLRKEKLDAPHRIDAMSKNILSLLKAEKPDVLVVEQLAVSRNFNTVRELCRVLDACYIYSLISNCIFVEMSPSEWRGTIGIQRSKCDRDTYKQMSIRFVRDTFRGLEISDDEADAICIGAAYATKYLFSNKYK